MYLPSMLRGIGFTLEECYKVYLGGINIATVFLSFYAFWKMTRKEVPAMIGSVLYAGSIVRIRILYRIMLGAVSAMAFYPLIVAGFYLLFSEDVDSEEYRGTWILLTVGFTGVLMTHMLSCLMAGVCAILVCIVMLKRLLRKKTFLMLFKAAVATVLLNFWFLVPFLQYMATEKLRINTKMAERRTITDYYASLADFTKEGKNIYHLFTDGDLIGFPMLLALLLFILMLVSGKLQRQVKIFSLLALFTVVLCTNLFPYVAVAQKSYLLMKIFLTIQYQDRWKNIAVVMLASMTVLFLSMEMFDRKKLLCIAGVLCCLTLYQDQQYIAALAFDQIHLDPISMESYLKKDLLSYNVVNGEYLPVATKTTELTTEIESEDRVSVEQTVRNGLSFEVNVRNDSAEERELLFPVLYYRGYRASDILSKEKLKTTIGDNGRVAVAVPPNYAGTVHLGYYEPLIWRITEMISVITLVVLIVMICNQNGKQIKIPKMIRKGVRDGNQKSDRPVIS